MNSDGSGFKIPPNLKQKTVALISSFLDIAAQKYANGDMGGCFKYLRGVKVKIAAESSKEDLNILSNIEKKINLLTFKYQPHDLDHIFTAEYINQKINSNLMPLVEEYEIQIRKMLDKVFSNNNEDGY
jgi:hypothetical protein